MAELNDELLHRDSLFPRSRLDGFVAQVALSRFLFAPTSWIGWTVQADVCEPTARSTSQFGKQLRRMIAIGGGRHLLLSLDRRESSLFCRRCRLIIVRFGGAELSRLACVLAGVSSGRSGRIFVSGHHQQYGPE